MKVVILAGGLPSNISDENDKIPKPMVRIGERPILWHIMKLYSYYGFYDFVICTGYRGEMIKRYFMDYYIYRSDITVDLETNDIKIHNNLTEPWNITIVDTGIKTATARRVQYALPYIEEEDFIVSYGDCVSNIDVKAMVETHVRERKSMTIAMAKPTGRNQIVPMSVDGEFIVGDRTATEIGAWVNACNMVVKKTAMQEISISEYDRFEVEILDKMIREKEVASYKHNGFWMPVETVRDRTQLQDMWNSQTIPWKVWED